MINEICGWPESDVVGERWLYRPSETTFLDARASTVDAERTAGLDRQFWT